MPSPKEPRKFSSRQLVFASVLCLGFFSYFKFFPGTHFDSAAPVTTTAISIADGLNDGVWEPRYKDSVELRCGTWQSEYIKLHQEIRSGNAKQRYVVFMCDNKDEESHVCGGLGDRLMGMVSSFLFSVLTKRAFVAHWNNPCSPQQVLYSPYIDWTLPDSEKLNALIEKGRKVYWFNAKVPQVHEMFTEVDLDKAFPEDVLLFYTNRGIVFEMMKSERYGPMLREMGLDAFSAFGCLLNFIAQPSKELWKDLAPYSQKLRQPGVVSVGLQIRTWDAGADVTLKIPRKSVSVKRYLKFIQCGQQIVLTQRATNSTVFFVATDSSYLRDALKEMYPNVIATDLTIAHSEYKFRKDLSPFVGLQSAIVENWLLSECDYLIMTSRSGFGKIASFRALRPHTVIFDVDKQGRDVDCNRPFPFVDTDAIVAEGAGG